MAQHRTVLEAGADPATVTGWINQTQAERDTLHARLAATPSRHRLTRNEITHLIHALGDIRTALRTADPTDKAEVCFDLGLR